MNQQGYVLMIALIIISILSVLSLFQLALIDTDITFLEYVLKSRLSV